MKHCPTMIALLLAPLAALHATDTLPRSPITDAAEWRNGEPVGLPCTKQPKVENAASSSDSKNWTRPRPLVAAARPVDMETAARPNFVFILADDLGWRDVGYEGHPLHATPHIDRLAVSGMRFTQAYSACAVCSPTRAAIMTGKHPARLQLTTHIRPDNQPHPTGVLKTPTSKVWLEPDEVTIAESLQEAGYVCGAIGKWHLGEQNGPPYRPQNQGFAKVVLSQRHGYFEYFYPFVDQTKWPYAGPLAGKPGDYLPDRLTDEALVFIEENRDKPFFLYLAHWSPHEPLQAKREKTEKYAAKLKARPNAGNATYAAMVESVDESVGRVCDKVQELGLAENTIVVFTSDNGARRTAGRDSSVAPLRGSKSFYYEGGTRVPLVVRWPGVVEPGAVCGAPVVSMDFYPTFLEMAGLPERPEQHRDGVSLVPVLRGAPRLARAELFWHFPHYHGCGGIPCSVIRQGNWKLIEFFETGQSELYDLTHDPCEQRNLAAEQPERAGAMRQNLAAWQRSVGAQLPTRP